MRSGESYGTMMDRELRRVRKMPATTLVERKDRMLALMDAVDDWKRKRDAAREHTTEEHAE